MLGYDISYTQGQNFHLGARSKMKKSVPSCKKYNSPAHASKNLYVSLSQYLYDDSFHHAGNGVDAPQPVYLQPELDRRGSCDPLREDRYCPGAHPHSYLRRRTHPLETTQSGSCYTKGNLRPLGFPSNL